MGKTRGWIVVGLLLLAAAVTWYVASPWWTLRQMAEAARAHDAAALSGYVDYPKLRASTKAQVHARFDRLSAGSISNAGSILIVATDLIADDLVDQVITPKGLETIFVMERTPSKDAAPYGEAGSERAPDKPTGLGAANREIVREGLNGFRLHAKGKAGQDGDLIFERHGLSWKLARIQLPEDVLGAL